MKIDEKILDLFIEAIGKNCIVSTSGDNPYKIETNKKTFYIYLKQIGSAHLPGKPDVSRIQIPQSTKFDCVIQSDLTFFAIGYDFVERVFIIWDPEKVKSRLNQSKNFSLYSTYAHQHLVRVEEKTFHYKSKQIQDAIIILPEELEHVLMNYTMYFEDEEKSQPQRSTESIDWEGMFINSDGKLTKLANPALLEKLKECLQQPYPSIPQACNIIVGFYGKDRFPNMELHDWISVINNIDWDLPDKILTANKKDTAEEKLSTSDENSNDVNIQTGSILHTDEVMILALDLYIKVVTKQILDIPSEVNSLAKKIGLTSSTITDYLLDYSYIHAGKGLSEGAERCKPFWDKYVMRDDFLLLQKKVKKILNKIPKIGVSETNTPPDKISVEDSSCNVNLNRLDVTSDKSLRKKNTVLRVIRPDGSIIEESKAAVTMGEAIKELGVFSVKNLGITHDNMNLIQVGGNLKYPGQQYYLGFNLYLNTHSCTERKKRQLEKIFNMLSVNWKVEIV